MVERGRFPRTGEDLPREDPSQLASSRRIDEREWIWPEDGDPGWIGENFYTEGSNKSYEKV